MALHARAGHAGVLLPDLAERRRVGSGLRLTSRAQTLAGLPPDELERAYNEALVLGLVTHREVRVAPPHLRLLRPMDPDARAGSAIGIEESDIDQSTFAVTAFGPTPALRS